MSSQEWVVVAIDPGVEWVEGETTTLFREREMMLRPETPELWGDVSLLRLPGEEYFTAATLVHRFLSAMAWKRQAAIRVEGHSGGTHRIRVGGRRQIVGFRVRMLPGFDLHGLVEQATSEQELALALYREAVGIADNTYRFLGLFRILNISLRTPQQQIEWINRQLPEISFPGRSRADELRTAVPPPYQTVGDYLYAAGRSALAHAFAPPFIDPDVMDHTYRINLDLIVVEGLVERYMTEELRLPRPV